MKHDRPLVALAGNPNSGKTSLFNRITGARQKVANYPGVTVEKKEGTYRGADGSRALVVDLPGIYSLTAHSAEERVARHFLLEERPDVVIDVIDASNPERNLYLALQILQLGVPVVLAFNMSDVARARGVRMDLQKLSALLGVPIVSTVAHKGEGVDALMAEALRVARDPSLTKPAKLRYGSDVEAEIDAMIPDLIRISPDLPPDRVRWTAVKLIEGDAEVRAQPFWRTILEKVDQARARLASRTGSDVEILLADRRYGFIAGACHEAALNTPETRREMSDRIDAVLTHPVLGLPIFLAFMYGVFSLTFRLGARPMGWIETGFARLTEWLNTSWPGAEDSPLLSLLADGIIGGVGGVLVFLPVILLLFAAIAALDQSGYLARAAFIMDRFLHRIGLHGKSFVPMLIGFGCTVPAILAARTLDNRRDRFATIFALPLISCGARLTIYMLIIPAFFPLRWQAPVLWSIYLVGILLAVGAIKLLRLTVLRGETMPLVIELPPYRIPTLTGVALHMWGQAWLYLRKAGTLILGISIVMWALTSYPKKTVFDRDYETLSAEAEANGNLTAEARADQLRLLENERETELLLHTWAGRVGRNLEPVLRPLGFDWRIGTALIGSFAAKEVFVAQMGIVFSMGEGEETDTALREKLRAAYSPLVGFGILLFCLIATPCMATIAATRQETQSWRWALFQFAGLTLLAYILALLLHQGGRLLGWA
ncbi:MAG: ferrous iron transport protein B [Kiritimatiellia bacterium]|nr:ferrous iron transport protein B [Kiritimatiellia bacterium]